MLNCATLLFVIAPAPLVSTFSSAAFTSVLLPRVYATSSYDAWLLKVSAPESYITCLLLESVSRTCSEPGTSDAKPDVPFCWMLLMFGTPLDSGAPRRGTHR